MSVEPSDDGLLALQFSSFRLDNTPPWVLGSSIITHVAKDGSRDTIASGFGPSAGFSVTNDAVYVTNLFFGTVMKISPSSTSTHMNVRMSDLLSVAPNPINKRLSLTWTQTQSGKARVQLLDQMGTNYFTSDLGYFVAGQNSQQYEIPEHVWSRIPSMPLTLIIHTPDGSFTTRLVKVSKIE